LGVKFLISKNIEYYNIKPDNIFSFGEKIKLVDYGINFLNNEIINNYMSPELFKNQINKL